MYYFLFKMLKIYYQNVNRFRSKLKEFYLNVLNCNYDIICLTETNLNGGVFDGELFDDRYNVYRRDREDTGSSKSDGGGVLVATKKSLNVIRQVSLESHFEDLWICIFPPDTKSPCINICTCYLPPSLSTLDIESFYNHCEETLLHSKHNNEFLLVGDFNTTQISWLCSGSNTLLSPNNPLDKKADLLIDFMTFFDLNQYNIIPNCNDRYLDLVLSTSKHTRITQCHRADPLSREDRHHPPLSFDLITSLPIKTMKHNDNKRVNFRKCDFASVKEELRAFDWTTELDTDSVDSSTEKFYKILNDTIHRHTPLARPKSERFPHWYSSSLIKCLKEKNKFHKLYKKHGNPRDYDVYSLLRARSKRLTDSCYSKFITSVESSLSDNIKFFWRYIHSRKSHSCVPQTMSFRDHSDSTGDGICKLFSEYFGSVYDKCSTTSSHIYNVNFKNDSIISEIVITVKEILTKIKSLDINKGAGPDSIPPFFIKACAEELTYPLCIIYNKSLKTGIFPTTWKTAHIVPIHKSGDKSKCENYRPISLLSCFAKLFESLVYEHMYNHLKQSITTMQHGFVRNRSTVSNLLLYKNYLCSSFATNGQTDSIYMDFRKAFDKVDHSILCRKLWGYGLQGCLFRWVSSYLINRSQLVTLQGYLSTPITVTSGIPQGSHLGPLFFVVFINDLVETLSCPALLYADDLKVYKSIETLQDCHQLQHDLNNIQEWCSTNRMSLNTAKCFIITFSKKKKLILSDYFISGHKLERRDQIKDLGIIFDSQLSFRPHYDYIINRANRLLGFVSRSTKEFKKCDSFLTLYYSLVRSVLEYGNVIWSPYYETHVNRLECVQKRATRILWYRSHSGRTRNSYERRLAKYNMTSLKHRRTYCSLVYLSNILHSRIDSPELLGLISISTQHRTRTHNTFALKVHKNNTSFYNPIVRMCREYNDLSSKVETIDIFNSNQHTNYLKIIKEFLKALDIPE